MRINQLIMEKVDKRTKYTFPWRLGSSYVVSIDEKSRRDCVLVFSSANSVEFQLLSRGDRRKGCFVELRFLSNTWSNIG